MKSIRDQIRTQLADLKMPGSLDGLDTVLSRVDSGLGAAEAISAVLGAQISLRNNRRLQAAMRSSRLPAVKTLSDFDFSFQPSLKREQIESLSTLGSSNARRMSSSSTPPVWARHTWPSAWRSPRPRADAVSTMAPSPISS